MSLRQEIKRKISIEIEINKNVDIGCKSRLIEIATENMTIALLETIKKQGYETNKLDSTIYISSNIITK